MTQSGFTWLSALIAASALLLTSCSYRFEAPPDLGEPLTVTIARNQSRHPTVQGHLQRETVNEIRNYLGWQVQPIASARLSLSIIDDEINVTSTGDLGIPNRYRVSINGTWTLTTERFGDWEGRFTGRGTYSSRADERVGLREAAQQAAREISAELQNRLRRYQDRQAMSEATKSSGDVEPSSSTGATPPAAAADASTP